MSESVLKKLSMYKRLIVQQKTDMLGTIIMKETKKT